MCIKSISHKQMSFLTSSDNSYCSTQFKTMNLPNVPVILYAFYLISPGLVVMQGKESVSGKSSFESMTYLHVLQEYPRTIMLFERDVIPSRTN